MCKPEDWLSLRRRQTWELLKGFLQSGFAVDAERLLVLQILQRATLHDVAVSDLVRKNAFLSSLVDIDYSSNEETGLLTTILLQCAIRLPVLKVGGSECALWWNAILSGLTACGDDNLLDKTHAIRHILVKFDLIVLSQADQLRLLNSLAVCLTKIDVSSIIAEGTKDVLVVLHDSLLRYSTLSANKGICGSSGLLQTLRLVAQALTSHSKELRRLLL